MVPGYTEETVLEVHHWTDKLFTLKTTRLPELPASRTGSSA